MATTLQSTLHPVFAEITGRFVRTSGYADFTSYDRAMYPDQVAAAEELPLDCCESCFQPNVMLVATIDGLTCAGCMEIARSEAQAELMELAADIKASAIAQSILRHAEVA